MFQTIHFLLCSVLHNTLVFKISDSFSRTKKLDFILKNPENLSVSLFSQFSYFVAQFQDCLFIKLFLQKRLCKTYLDESDKKSLN